MAANESARAAARALNKEVHKTDSWDNPQPLQVSDGTDNLTAFPSQYYSRHPLEERARVLKTAQGLGLVDETPSDKALFQKPTFDAEALDYVRQKQQADELVLFEQWLATKFNMDDMYQVDKVNKLFPAYFERKRQQVRQTLDLAERLALIRLQGGPRSADDLALQYRIETGAVDVQNIQSVVDALLKGGKVDAADQAWGWMNNRRRAPAYTSVSGNRSFYTTWATKQADAKPAPSALQPVAAGGLNFSGIQQ